MLVFGSVFWTSATEDYYNKLNGETYRIDDCLQYMEPPLSSMEERDDCTQKRQLGGIFTTIGIVSLWATIYINKDYIFQLLKDCLLYTSPSPRDRSLSRMPSSA